MGRLQTGDMFVVVVDNVHWRVKTSFVAVLRRCLPLDTALITAAARYYEILS